RRARMRAFARPEGERSHVSPRNNVLSSVSRMRPSRIHTVATVSVCLMTCLSCGAPNHTLIHPHSPPSGEITWAADFSRDELLAHVEGARPPGPGPFPAVIVHPEGGMTADEMHGVIWDLAQHGFVALAVDYQRFIDGRWTPNLFAWRSESD